MPAGTKGRPFQKNKLKIGLIDVDGHNFPNLPLMKLSAWHKYAGHEVEWYQPMFSGHMDRVYMSKVFDFTADYPYYIDADVVIQGGTGYANAEKTGKQLPYSIEHIYPDYSLYPERTKDTAYGFLTRGCPRGCGFCIVGDKEGRTSYKVANLIEFWRGQKNIVLLDPNITACREWKELFQQLIDSRTWVDFSQGLDIRLMTEEKAEMLKLMKVKQVHFAWDNYSDKDKILPQFKAFKDITGWDKRKLPVYVLTNYNSTHEEDLERIYILREMGYWPYVMIYNKDKLPKGHVTRRLQRWVNMRAVFETIPIFAENRCDGTDQDNIKANMDIWNGRVN